MKQSLQEELVQQLYSNLKTYKNTVSSTYKQSCNQLYTITHRNETSEVVSNEGCDVRWFPCVSAVWMRARRSN